MPATGQLCTFLLGNAMLAWADGTTATSHESDEYRLFPIAQSELTSQLNQLTIQSWEIVTITLRDDGTSVVLMKRKQSRV